MDGWMGQSSKYMRDFPAMLDHVRFAQGISSIFFIPQVMVLGCFGMFWDGPPFFTRRRLRPVSESTCSSHSLSSHLQSVVFTSIRLTRGLMTSSCVEICLSMLPGISWHSRGDQVINGWDEVDAISFFRPGVSRCFVKFFTKRTRIQTHEHL